MFSYYGSKAQLIGHYPLPVHRRVIEPFCGAANYALKYWYLDVWINDRYPVIYRIWKWIQQASKDDIRSLPEVEQGVSLKYYKYLSQEERWLLGFCLGRGCGSPRHRYSPWAYRKNAIAVVKRRLLRYVGKINHWTITNLEWWAMPNRTGTWFIDPPYVNGGKGYVFSNINYTNLGRWCLERNGQAIVCENGNADWLPFRPLCKRAGSRYETQEVIFDFKQLLRNRKRAGDNPSPFFVSPIGGRKDFELGRQVGLSIFKPWFGL